MHLHSRGKFLRLFRGRKKLYDLHRVREMQESNVRPYAAFPIVQLDRQHPCR
mgnify:CR=1 FL=1